MPSRPGATRWIAALAALVLFVLLAWWLGRALARTDGERLFIRAALVTLGVVTAGSIVWFLRPKGPPPPAASTTDDAVAAVDAARARLPRGEFDGSPLVLLLGLEGSAKTTIVSRAGLDAELLAGDAVGDPPAATAAANVWKVRGAVLAEAGGKLIADAARWQRLAQSLRAPRVAAALGRGESAPRAAVVCVGCDLFYHGGVEPADAAAQLLRQRLGDVARDWGLARPVYVLFTKADRIPHFAAWAGALDHDDVRAPLGASLPFDAQGAAGAYAARLTPRLEAGFRQIRESLAAWRPVFLGREAAAERRLAAY